MAVLETLRNFFTPAAEAAPELVVPAASTIYSIHPLVENHLGEVLRLNMRCFKNGENYTKHTFAYLLTVPSALSYRINTAEGVMAGFICAMVGTEGNAHVTTVGVAPEHRRRGLAALLLSHLEGALKIRGVGAVVLEVRVSNIAAQVLYKQSDYSVVQRLQKYYNNGEDGFLMMKSLI